MVNSRFIKKTEAWWSGVHITVKTFHVAMIHKVSIKVPPLCLLGFLFALVSYMTVTKYVSMVQNNAEDPGMARLYFFWFFPASLTNCQNERHQ